MQQFGTLLRRLRGNRTQREIAEELAIPPTTLSSMENQDAIPRGPILKKLADFYGVSIEYFYAGPTSEPRSVDSARQWLNSIRKGTDFRETVVMHSQDEFSEKEKEHIATQLKTAREKQS